VARTGRRSAALDRHSADYDRTGCQAYEANPDYDLCGQAEASEAVARGAVQGDVGDGDDHQDRRGGRQIAAQTQQHGGSPSPEWSDEEQALRRCKSCFLHPSPEG
jgi:hypothetical protein